MNHERIKEIKKEDKKAMGKFALLILLSLIAGGVIGAFIGMADKQNLALTDKAVGYLNAIAPYSNFVVAVIAAVSIFMLYQKSRSRFRNWDGENEEEMNQIERLLSYAMWISSVGMVASFFFFSVSYSVLADPYSLTELSNIFYILGGLIAALVVVVISQQKIVNFEKEINPEKSGSVYDRHFVKKWEESCDEAEKLSIYKAAYKSHRAVSRTCLLLWLFCTVGKLIWNFGLAPVSMVSIIWLVQISSYCLEAIRLTKSPTRIQK